MSMNQTDRDGDGLTTDDGQLLDDFGAYTRKIADIDGYITKILSPVGILLNVVFVVVAVRVKSMRTIINVFLANLAVADTFFLALGLSVSWINTKDVEPFVLDVVRSLVSTANIASFSFVTAVAVERLSAVLAPLTHRAKATKTRAAKISAGLWVLAAVFCAVFITTSATLDQDNTIKAYAIFFLIFHLATFTITVSSYVAIVIKLKLRHQKLADGSQTSPSRLRPVVRMLIVNTAIFFVLNAMEIAYEIVIILILRLSLQLSVVEYIRYDRRLFDLALCVVTFRQLNSSVNTLVYSATNGDYRAAVVQTFRELIAWGPGCLCHRPGGDRRRNAAGTSPPAQAGEEIELAVIEPRQATA